jgi:hypothetical protein
LAGSVSAGVSVPSRAGQKQNCFWHRVSLIFQGFFSIVARGQKEIFMKINLLRLTAIALSTTALGVAQFIDKGEYVEVIPGTKLCDPAEDVYGFYLVKSKMKPDGTQEIEYYRFRSLLDSQNRALAQLRQPIGPSAVWFKRHPQQKDKLQVIDPRTGEADEFPYASCKKQ